MAKKQRLGRGLDSLIPEMPELDVRAPRVQDERADATNAAGVQTVPLQKIELNPKQPRLEMDPQELERLSASIRESGVIQPVVVRPRGDVYELVVGERRLRATLMAGLDSIPAVIRDVPDDRLLELALVENIQRADLNAIEKAKAVSRMIEELDLTQEEAGRRLGLERSTVTNLLRLLELAEELQQMVSRGTLSAGHARALLGVEDYAARAAAGQGHRGERALGARSRAPGGPRGGGAARGPHPRAVPRRGRPGGVALGGVRHARRDQAAPPRRPHRHPLPEQRGLRAALRVPDRACYGRLSGTRARVIA